MCGRVFQVRPAEEIATAFKVKGPVPNSGPRYNAAPSQDLLVIRRHPDTGERCLDKLKWGLVPSWTKDIKAARKPINAMSETVEVKPMFKGAFAKRRCALVCDGFYEWWSQGPKNKRPYAIALFNRETVAMAGLWENWRDPDSGEWVRTFCVLTTEANSLVGKIHDRMPVILEEHQLPAWLGEEPSSLSDLKGLCTPYPSERMTMWPVDRRVGSPRFDDPCILDIIDEDTPHLTAR